MKRLCVVLTAGVLICAATQSIAQPSVSTWTGCYIGGSVGGLWGRAKIDNDFAAPTSVQADPAGFMGGGQFGCDYQPAPNWLMGLQGEFNGSGAHDSKTVAPPFPYVSEMLDARVNWFANATARLGYVSGPWLIYGRGGAAWVNDRLHNVGALASSSFDFSDTVTRTGWMLGAGFEFKFAPNWSAIFEYGFYDFGGRSLTMSGTSSGPRGTFPGTNDVTFKQNFSVVKIGINYRFSSGP